LVKNLEHLAIYRNIVNLCNPVAQSAMQGAVSLEQMSTFTQRGRSDYPTDPKPLANSGNENIVSVGEKIFFVIRNNSKQDIFVTLFELDPDYGVTKIYPSRTTQQRVAPDSEIPIRGTASLRNPNLGRGRSIYKVIATITETNLDILSLPKLNEGEPQTATRVSTSSSLGRIVNALRGDGTRELVLDMDETDDEWVTAQFEVTVEAAGRATELRAGETTATLDAPATQVTITKPSAFSAVLKLFGLSQSTRGVD
ncbi:MAG: hypothetical protein KDE54_08395, partial [Caldilineaceae bacterium]|nr:hypothetical protein [Caldilineaceae bacterium]